MNKSLIIGRLGRDPELKHTASGKAIASFAIAIDDGTKTNPHTSWIDCTAWERTAEMIADRFRKGQQIAVEGRLRQESWETDDGKRRNKIVVIVDHVTFLDRPRGDHDQTPAAYDGEQSQATTVDVDTPF